MKIILCDTDSNVVEAWKQTLSGSELESLLPMIGNDIEIICGNILEVECDALVSPANSFGFMDGGLDLAYSLKLGWQVQEFLQDRIREEHRGELVVGNACVVPTDRDNIPYVISAPTMRVPMILPKDTVNPYLATKAALAEAWEYTEIRSIAFPGMGTGVGMVQPGICARQMITAIHEVLLNECATLWCLPKNYHDAQVRHIRLYSDEVRDLQFA